MDVFVYGTLTDAEQAGRVCSSFSYEGAAVCSGLHRVDGQYPTLAPGGEVGGRLLRTADIEALDRYEGVDRGLYERVSVPLDSDDLAQAAVYVGDPDRLGVAVEWPGSGSFAERVRAYLAGHDVSVRRM